MAKRMTIAEFKEKAREKFKNKFNYDKVIFIHSKEAVPITCPIHGEFLQIPFKHLKSKYGCPKCGWKKTADAQSISTEEFIEKARKVHGVKYDYTKVDYTSNHKKVLITCLLHGDFEQTPGSHLSGRGCPKCGGSYKLNTKEFIEKARKVHGNKYTYDKAEYNGNKQKMIITCSVHGDFKQKPSYHLSGCGCPICGGRYKINTKEFIEKARKVHGEKYDYSKVDYTSNHKKVLITCLLHGDFKQTPGSHLNGNGCPKCGRKKMADALSISTKEFIEKARKVHGEKYDYSKVDYTSGHKKVLITCLLHGDFKQTPSSHLSRHGCPKCGGSFKMTFDYFIKKATEKHGTTYDYSKVDFKSRNDEVTIICPVHGEFKQKPRNHIRSGCPLCGGSYKLNTKEFIEKAKLVHDNFYSYENAVYQNSSTKIEINCPYHGTFFQLPPSHLKGHGCPTCRNSRGEFRIEKYLKQIRVSYDHQYTFKDCKNVYPLPFDFAVFIENKIGLIEFNGEQHYREIDFGHSKENRSDFDNIKLRDSIKREYCENNNFPLLIINYDQLDDTVKLINEFVTKIMDT